MAEFADQFELVGDTDALSDEFYDALADLLIDIDQATEPPQDADEGAHGEEAR